MCVTFSVASSTFSFAGELIEAPITWYNVKKNRKYRFRVINVGSIYPFRVSVDEHNITVIASDGYDLKSQLVESFVINPGERFDFLLETNQPVKNYWIRANSMEVCITQMYAVHQNTITLYSDPFNVLKTKKISQMKEATCFHRDYQEVSLSCTLNHLKTFILVGLIFQVLF